MSCRVVEASWNVMAHAQKPDFVFRRNGRVHLNWRGRQFSRLLAAEVCASAVVMLDTPCSEVVRRVLATHYIRQFPLHFPSGASPCAITFNWSLITCPSTSHNISEDWCFISTDVRNWNLAKETLRLQKVGLPYVKADVTCSCYRHVQTQRALTFYFCLRAPQTEIKIIFSTEFYMTYQNFFSLCMLKRRLCFTLYYTGLFKIIVGVQLSSGNSAPNSGNNHHLTIPFEGGVHSFKGQGACVSRNWRYESEPPMKPSPLTCYNLERTRLSCWCL